MIYKFFDKKSFSGVVTRARSEKLATRHKSAIKSEIMPDQLRAEELYKPVITKFEKQNLCSSFKDNIWGADLGDMQLK